MWEAPYHCGKASGAGKAPFTTQRTQTAFFAAQMWDTSALSAGETDVMTDTPPSDASGNAPAPEAATPRKPLSPSAQRALAEAQARRAAMEQRARELASRVELGGRGGPDPVRYNDWENNGIASDF